MVGIGEVSAGVGLAKEGIKIARKIHKIFFKKEPCYFCGGKKEIDCRAKLCSNGYYTVIYTGGGYKKSLIQKNGDYFIRLENLRIDNQGIEGCARVNIVVFDYNTAQEVSKFSNKMKLKNGENQLGTKDLKLDLSSLPDEIKPKEEDFNVHMVLTEIEKIQECPTCKGTGKETCSNCNPK
jgi:hypothetical protein